MSTGGRNTKLVVLAMGIIVAVGAISYFGGFYPPATDESTGAIGAAKRFRTEQMTDRDVVLEDSQVAAFMQTDTFDRIMKDSAARKMLRSEEFQAAMRNDSMADLLGKPQTRKVFENAGLVSLMEGAEASSAQRVRNRIDAELVATVVEVAGRNKIQDALAETSAHGRRQLLVNAAAEKIADAEGKGGLSLLNDAEFRKAIVAIQPDALSGAMYADAEGRKKSPVTDAGTAAKVHDAMTTDAEGRGGRKSIIFDALSNAGKMNDSWARELNAKPYLRAVALATALNSNAFKAQFDDASGRQQDRKYVDAASQVFTESLGQKKFDRLMLDGAALEKLHDAAAKGAGPMVAELAAAAQTDAQWGALFNDAEGRKGGPIAVDTEAMANVALVFDLAQRGGGKKFLMDVSALVTADAAAHGAVLDALGSNAKASKFFADANLLKTVRSIDGGD